MLKHLKNRYFIIRHGESKANVRGILLSHPKEGTVGFELTRKGKKQVKDSVLKNKQNKLLDSDVIIYSSDFLRVNLPILSPGPPQKIAISCLWIVM